jgi:DNA-binding XRE family transcriptional regulator
MILFPVSAHNLHARMVSMDTLPWEKAPVATRFRVLRRKALLTQLHLARLIGIGRQAISKIENQRSMPHRSTWDAFRSLEERHRQPEIVLPTKWK